MRIFKSPKIAPLPAYGSTGQEPSTILVNRVADYPTHSDGGEQLRARLVSGDALASALAG